MINILIADKIDKSVIDQIKNSKFFFDYKPEITPEELLKTISNYEALVVRSRTKVTKEVIDLGHNLKIIGRVGSGLDNIDLVEIQKRKIKVINSPESNSEAVTELAIGLILSLLRKLSSSYSSMSQGLWLKRDFKGQELGGKKVGVIGFGHIGKSVAKILTAFGAKVDYYSRTQKTNSLKYIFKHSDIITVHLPLNNATKNLINNDLLSLMKPTSFFINTSRGGVVEEKSLFKLLQEKKIAGAALDVFWQEPLPPVSSWRKLPNVILTPHIGASTNEALEKGTKTVIDEIIKILGKK
ncbi:3-phosphoglycerate dehydrogenase [Candidatus Roizmanbacteria bacterium CG_4_8_14_3_um_filter_34_9]|uniref:3-phosphoglycerate dehydrogenase n=3 Tax=Candidatus Roizmaniibacteriota TaxID=1752723 RepID=A0A2M7AUI4_9BACT|nr:MAG: 3-phosphoglycerate dehydrogenase [Candidatus Roizmanbacteria bacterium CG07_land_8_20_14_0_80_34_15]PIU74223.1 MAG: 3-phosphoglycerate dehydrogenase [Candidatus Roizmanbacteria bacterium CG06_land_8_20_14_3_00_34_14]PIW73539.1 MAG: 3-phosphoglycerate dehydrogenase [Candidatus Roizmanbacteria bacterium CG_4_8_14_3_um_filter_34_9]